MILFTILADFLTYSVFKMEKSSHLASSIHFFIEDTSKIFFLLFIMIYLIALVRAGVDTDRIRNYLKGKNRGIGYVLAALFGSITPFCSCSSIPPLSRIHFGKDTLGNHYGFPHNFPYDQ